MRVVVSSRRARGSGSRSTHLTRGSAIDLEVEIVAAADFLGVDDLPDRDGPEAFGARLLRAARQVLVSQTSVVAIASVASMFISTSWWP